MACLLPASMAVTVMIFPVMVIMMVAAGIRIIFQAA